MTKQYRDTNNRFKEQLVYTDIMKEQYRLNNLEREQSGNRFKVPVSRDFFWPFSPESNLPGHLINRLKWFCGKIHFRCHFKVSPVHCKNVGTIDFTYFTVLFFLNCTDIVVYCPCLLLIIKGEREKERE